MNNTINDIEISLENYTADRNCSGATISRKERKRMRKTAKRAIREEEDRLRLLKRKHMMREKSLESLKNFIDCEAMNPLLPCVGCVELDVPLWDTQLLVEDCKQLLERFSPGKQFGKTHDGSWTTLSLRSCDGTCNNDNSSPIKNYLNTPAWFHSSYIVPTILHSFDAELILRFERIRLSIVPPGCNIAWHCDYMVTEHHVSRIHIPIIMSNGFEMNIGGTNVQMEMGKSYIGNFELPHRLMNNINGTLRIHLIIDILLPLSHIINSCDNNQGKYNKNNYKQIFDYITNSYLFCWLNCTTNTFLTHCIDNYCHNNKDNKENENHGGTTHISSFHVALNKANILLEGTTSDAAQRIACIDAFLQYRCSRGDSVETQACIEKDFYLLHKFEP
jgi:hypothetical protein